MHGEHERDGAPRVGLTLGHAAVVALMILLLAGGPHVMPELLRPLSSGDGTRRAVLAALAGAYLIRFSLTTLWLLPRSMDWREALVVGPWLALIHGTFLVLGGTNADPVDPLAVAGVVLFIVGSGLGTEAEWMRLRWKQRPEHRGHLYTGGPFGVVMHPNYLGDILLFTGYALVTGRVMALVIPLLVTAGFIFVHIPALDRHLASRYGEEFRRHAGHTARLVPGLW